MGNVKYITLVCMMNLVVSLTSCVPVNPTDFADCNFESGMCFWHQLDKNNIYKWKRITGQTPTHFTGPDGDDTKGLQGKGYYVYAEASPAKIGQVAKLQSKTFSATPARCIQFSYNMYGDGMGSLNVYVVDEKTRTKTLIFTKNGDQGRKWYKIQVTIASANSYKASFEVTRGYYYKSDIALDDIMFKDGKCAGELPGQIASIPIFKVSDNCSFEKDICFWHQFNKNKPYKWKRITGRTPTHFTGPDGDATKGLQGKGYYVYAEASPAKIGQVAKLQSKTFSATLARCIQFSYNMYGDGMGSLNVYVVDKEIRAKTLIFTMNGDQGQPWYKAQATIRSENSYKVSFEVTRGYYYKSDIALDDITFKDGKCAGKQPGLTTARPLTVAYTTSSHSTAAQITSSHSTAAITTSSPSTAAPTTSSPSTAAPTLSSPSTAAQITSSPSTAAQITSSPSTAAPTTSRHSTAAQITPSPSTAAITTSSPSTTAITTSSPSTAAPTTSSPSTAVLTTSRPCKGTLGTEYKPIGCFKDKTSSRALPTFVGNFRDQIDWHDLSKTVKMCAEAAGRRGFRVFGLQFYGECWSGKDACLTYDKYGPSDNCAFNVGTVRSNYIYTF